MREAVTAGNLPEMVSVPCRGTTFLNFAAVHCEKAHKWFPSPVGELHFSIKWQTMKKAIKIVSVPCRGTTFLNNIKVFYVECKKQFPSPVGELHFSMRYKIHKKSHLIVSVPRRGTTFLNKGTGKFKSWVMITVSVPCRGTTFLNENAEVHQFAAEVGFRPLSGNYISQ